MDYQTIELYGIKLTVGYTVSGQYYPATYYEPAEYPELDIQTVTAYDSEIDLLPLLEQYEETIYELLNNKL
jgi:hypothetical protein